MATPDLHDLVGAYLLDAIEPEERAAFEEHLEGCPSCRAEVAALRPVAASLAEPTAAEPPPAIWERVMARVVITPQLAPGVPHPRHAARLSRRRVLQWAAAAAAAVVVGGGVAAIVSRNDEGAPTAADVFAADDAQARTVATDRGTVRVGASPSLGLVAVDTSALRPAGTGRTYQLWLVPRTGSPESLAVLGGAHSATAPIGNGSLAVTDEPAGGSPRPTTEPLFAVPVADL
jgi:anti-sigma-K factor RskA